jgi:hypothetical protein
MAIDKLKTSSLEDNSVTSPKLAPGAVTEDDISDSSLPLSKLSEVDLNIAPEVLEIQVSAPAAGQATTWLWTWLTSSLPYARRTITNSPELQVPLYKQGTYTVNNFAAYDLFDSMTQTHSLYLKWIDGAGTDNLVSWATSTGPVSDTHPDINGGNPTDVQRINISVPATITVPTLTPPSVSYTVVNNGAGAYTFSGAAKGDNPNLGPFYRGGTYTINITATGHPFYFTTDNGTNFAAGTYFGEYTDGVTGSRTDSGTITFTVPNDAPDTLYYQCGNHGVMRGAITIKNLAVETNINGNYVVYFQHTQEGHKTPVELRPIPSLVNQMCLVYDADSGKFVPQDLATYVENTPSFENKIREVAGTAELVVEDGSAVIAKVNVYDDSTYLPLVGNNPGDQAFATDTDILYIWDGSAWQQAGASNSDDLTEGTTNLFYTDARVNTYLSSNGYDTATNIVATITDSAPATLDTLNELAAALGDDADFANTVSTQIGTKWTQDNTKISNWDTAYSWGDHSLVGYLTSYTETDPIYTASSWYTTTNNSTNWDTAYGWGDHSTQGYITSADGGNASTLDGLDSTQFLRSDVDSTLTGVLTINGGLQGAQGAIASPIVIDNPNAFGTSASDNFGNSVAISGNRAIVGAYGEDEDGGSFSGKAYIFDVTTGSLLHTLNNPNAYGTSDFDFFGSSVAISGNYAIVGAYFEDDAGGTGSGKAYIFDVTTGGLLHTLDNPNASSTSQNDNFSFNVAISGNRAIVGAHREDDGGTDSGKAYIFDVATGALVHTLDNPNAYGTTSNDTFGISVAISGNRAIVGAHQEDDAGGTESGKAYIFDVTTGLLVHTLDNPNAYSTSLNDYFGSSVAISGNYAIVGTNNEDDAGGTTSGKAYIFDVTTGGLLHTLDNPNAYSTSEGDQFGYSVSISGNYAIVGASYEDDAGGTTSGKAYIFDATTGLLVHTLDNPNAYSTAQDDQFGRPVSISGNYAIVGARPEDDDGGSFSGKAYIYDLPAKTLFVDGNSTISNDLTVTNDLTVNGNVGIGTTNPLSKLHVYNSNGGDATDKATMLSEAVLKLQPHATNSTNLLVAQVNSGNGIGLQVTNGPATANWDIALSPFGGRVGIGTAVPNDVLTIQGADNGLTIKSEVANRPKITLMNGTSGMLTISANGTYGAIGDSSNANRYMAFNGDNVGVGTTNPGYKFQVNGISHTRGLITNPTAYGGNSGSGTKGSTTLGAGKYWDTSYTNGYMHIVLPSRYNDGNSKMFFLEVKGYDFNRPGIIDLKYGGYVTPSSNGGPISRSVVLDNYGGYSPAVYYSSNYGAGVCRFYWPSGVYYGSFTINTIASGNGDVIQPDELQIILSSNSTI